MKLPSRCGPTFHGAAALRLVLRLLCLLCPLLLSCAPARSLHSAPVGVSARWIAVGEQAPEIVARSLDGSVQRLSMYAGRVVLVTFWTTFCGPCRQELPAVEALCERYPELAVLGVSLDEDDDDDSVRAAAHDMHLRFPVLRDAQGRAAFAYMKHPLTPFTAVVGRDGRLRALHRGYFPPLARRLDAEVREALAEIPAIKPSRAVDP